MSFRGNISIHKYLHLHYFRCCFHFYCSLSWRHFLLSARRITFTVNNILLAIITIFCGKTQKINWMQAAFNELLSAIMEMVAFSDGKILTFSFFGLFGISMIRSRSHFDARHIHSHIHWHTCIQSIHTYEYMSCSLWESMLKVYAESLCWESMLRLYAEGSISTTWCSFNATQIFTFTALYSVLNIPFFISTKNCLWNFHWISLFLNTIPNFFIKSDFCCIFYGAFMQPYVLFCYKMLAFIQNVIILMRISWTFILNSFDVSFLSTLYYDINWFNKNFSLMLPWVSFNSHFFSFHVSFMCATRHLCDYIQHQNPFLWIKLLLWYFHPSKNQINVNLNNFYILWI